MKTVEDVLERIKILEQPINQSDAQFFNMSDAFFMIEVLANEIKALKREIVTQKLLIEHEENARTRKQPKTLRKNFTDFKEGDRVVRLKGPPSNIGTVLTTKGSRVKVKFGDIPAWVDARSIRHNEVRN